MAGEDLGEFGLGFERRPIPTTAADREAALAQAIGATNPYWREQAARSIAVRQGVAQHEADARDAVVKAALGELLTGNVYALQDRLGRAVLRSGGLTPPETMTLPQMFAAGTGHEGSPTAELVGDTLRDPLMYAGGLVGAAAVPLRAQRAIQIGTLIPAAVSAARTLPRLQTEATPAEAADKLAALERLDAARSR